MTEVTGIKETVAALDGLADDVAHMDDVYADVANKGAAIMRPFIPVATGALQKSAHGSVVQGAALITVGNPAVQYAPQINARVDFTGKATPAIEAMATHEVDAGVTTRIKNRGLDQ